MGIMKSWHTPSRFIAVVEGDRVKSRGRKTFNTGRDENHSARFGSLAASLCRAGCFNDLISLSRILNDKWAIQRAKENVDKYFPVVGILEELNSTLAVLEAKIPMFFKGVQHMYYRELLGKYRPRGFRARPKSRVTELGVFAEPHRNANRMRPKTTSAFVRSHLKKQLKTEYDFYYWLKARIMEQARDVRGEANFVPNRSWRPPNLFYPNLGFRFVSILLYCTQFLISTRSTCKLQQGNVRRFQCTPWIFLFFIPEVRVKIETLRRKTKHEEILNLNRNCWCCCIASIWCN